MPQHVDGLTYLMNKGFEREQLTTLRDAHYDLNLIVRNYARPTFRSSKLQRRLRTIQI